MARSAWKDKAPPVAVPIGVDIHFGAQPGWDTEREGKRINLALRNEAGVIEVVAEDVCYLCHDGLTFAEMPPGVVCGACGRYSGDAAVAAALAADPGPGPDTPEELIAWWKQPTEVKYPDRRPAPPVAKPRTKETPP